MKTKIYFFKKKKLASGDDNESDIREESKAKIDAQGGGGGRGLWSEKLSHKNSIKHEKVDPLDFLTTPSTPLKRIWPKPQGPPPGFPTTVHQWEPRSSPSAFQLFKLKTKL
jgi:hypothetical protein